MWMCIVSILIFLLCVLARQEVEQNRINKRIDELLREEPQQNKSVPTFTVYTQYGKEKNIENIKKISKNRLVWDNRSRSFVKVIELDEDDLV